MLINLLITFKNVQYVHYVYLVFFCSICTAEKLNNIYVLYNMNKSVHSCTTGTRVWVDSSSRVRIPPSPPVHSVHHAIPPLGNTRGRFFLFDGGSDIVINPQKRAVRIFLLCLKAFPAGFVGFSILGIQCIFRTINFHFCPLSSIENHTFCHSCHTYVIKL